MRLLRRLVFGLFVVGYLFLCPLTILYALGYLVTPGMEHGMVKTGLLYVATVPPGAAVYLGNTRYMERTPTMIRDLLPGQYPITVTLKQHLPWTHTILLEAGKSTALEKLLLWPQAPRSETLLAESFEELLPVPGTPWCLLRRSPRLGDHLVYDVERAIAWPLTAHEGAWPRARVTAITTVKESSAILVRAVTGQGPRLFRYELRKRGVPPEDLTPWLEGREGAIDWDPHDRRWLFLWHEGRLDRVDLLEEAIAPVATGVRGYGLSHRLLYVVRADGVLERREMNGGHPEVVEHTPPLMATLGREEGPFRLTMLSHELALYWGDHGELLVNHPPHQVVEGRVRGFLWDAGHEQVLVWTRNRLGLLDLSRDSATTEPYERGPLLTWVFTTGTHLDQAFWVYEGSHVLFRDGDEVFLLDLNPAGNLRPERVLQVKEHSAILYVESTGKVYYLDRATGHLMALTILP